jgi:hypothetical protein
MLHHELMSAGELELLGYLLVLLSTHRQARCKLMAQIAGVEATATGIYQSM